MGGKGLNPNSTPRDGEGGGKQGEHQDNVSETAFPVGTPSTLLTSCPSPAMYPALDAAPTKLGPTVASVYWVRYTCVRLTPPLLLPSTVQAFC